MASVSRCEPRDGISSLVFWGEAPGVTKVNRIPKPGGVTITWRSGRRDKFPLEDLAGGQARDVLASPDAPYVLKLQKERWYKF